MAISGRVSDRQMAELACRLEYHVVPGGFVFKLVTIKPMSVDRVRHLLLALGIPVETITNYQGGANGVRHEYFFEAQPQGKDSNS
jgi:hypothetical protein